MPEQSNPSVAAAGNHRLRYVDVARGLAMLSVILGHMGYDRLDIIIYSFHMPFFFLIAGYFQKREEHSVFCKRKARSLLVPYVFTSILVIVATQINNAAKIILHRDDAVSAIYLLIEYCKAALLGSGSRKDILWIQSDYIIGNIWFLLALFFAQVLVNLLQDKKFAAAFIAVIAAIGIASARYIWLPLSIQAGAAASVYVAVGLAYKSGGGTLSDLLERKAVVISCSFIWICYLGVSYYLKNTLALVNASYKLGIFDYIGPTAATIVILFISYQILDKLPIINSFLSWLGKNSLIMLCFHLIEMVALPFQSVIDFGLSLIGVNIAALSDFLTLLTKVIWCCFTIWLVNKSKTMRWIFNPKIRKSF